MGSFPIGGPPVRGLMVGENIFLMKRQKISYVKRKTAFKGPIRVEDFGLEK